MNRMKYFKLLLLIVPVMFFACSKGGDSSSTTTPTPTPTPTPTEAALTFKVEIDAKEIDYSSIVAALAATQAINVNVTSTLPKDGVTITVNVNKNLDNTLVYGNGGVASSTAATNAVSIANLTSGVLCTATVVVSSKTTSTNLVSKTFQIARK